MYVCASADSEVRVTIPDVVACLILCAHVLGRLTTSTSRQ